MRKRERYFSPSVRDNNRADRRSIHFYISAEAYCRGNCGRGWASRAALRIALSIVIVLAIWLTNVRESFSEQNCEQADLIGNSLVRPANRLGEFRFKLNPPNFTSAEAVQRHFAFAAVLAKLLMSTLRAKSNRQCDAVITSSSRFPYLSVYLYWRGQSSVNGTDRRSICTGILRDLLSQSRPAGSTITEIASQEADARRAAYSDPAEAFGQLAIELRLALADIYLEGTPLHALALADVGPAIFETFDVSDFLLWLDNQRSVPGDRLIAINTCDPRVGEASTELSPENAHGNEPFDKVPYAETIPPGPLHLTMKRAKSALARLTPPLRHFVIVGNNSKLSRVPLITPATAKLCNKPYTVPHKGGSSSDGSVAVTIRCYPEMFYGGEYWIAFFCDLNDCRSDTLAESVTAAIAIDPDVIDLAGDDHEPTRRRGPYLVDVDITYE
jgi:hypothetical protein